MKLTLYVVFTLMFALTISFVLGGCSHEETSIPIGGTDLSRITGKNQNEPTSQAPPENSVPVHSSDSSADTAATFSMFYCDDDDLIFSVNFPYLFHSDGTIYDSTFTRAMNEQKPQLLAVKDGWVYFWKENDRCLGRMRVDGTNITLFSNIKYGSHDAYIEPTKTAIFGDYLYFVDWLIYRIPLVENVSFDSKEIVQTALPSIHDFHIEDNWLFYTNYASETTYFRKVRLDGSDDTLLYNSEINNIVNMYYSNDGWIYFNYNINDDFNNRANDNITLFRMRKDGTDVTQIITDLGESAYIGAINGGWIYYYTNFELRRTRTDGSETETLLLSDRLFSIGGAQPFNVIGNYIFFAPDRGDEIPRVRADGTEFGVLRWLPEGGFRFSTME